MAKLQIFVFVLALSQVYGNVVTRPEPLPEVIELPNEPEIISLPCVDTVRALLQAIIERLPEVSVPTPHPIEPERPMPELEEEEPELAPELPPAVETPCSACFEHINSLLTSAEKVLAVKRMSAMLRM